MVDSGRVARIDSKYAASGQLGQVDKMDSIGIYIRIHQGDYHD